MEGSDVVPAGVTDAPLGPLALAWDELAGVAEHAASTEATSSMKAVIARNESRPARRQG